MKVGDEALWVKSIGDRIRVSVVGYGRDELGCYVEVRTSRGDVVRVHRSQLERVKSQLRRA